MIQCHRNQLYSEAAVNLAPNKTNAFGCEKTLLPFGLEEHLQTCMTITADVQPVSHAK